MEKVKRDVKFRFTFKDGNFFAKRYMTLDELLDSNFALEQMEESINSEVNIYDIEDYPDYEVFKDEYTGLKDKNGVEIYEGDIFTTLYITPMGDITDILSNEIYLVEFKNGMFGYSSKAKFNPLEDFIIKTKGEYISNCGCKTIYNETIIEVIGNIYENPDLLKG